MSFLGPGKLVDTAKYFVVVIGLLLHWTPLAFIRSVKAAVPATAGVLIQCPFCAGIFGMITRSSISHEMAQFFVRISTPGTYPVLIAVYSAVLGLFVPSAGSKWLIEPPISYRLRQLHVNLGWVVQIYNTAEALPNLINPFWMLPLLGLLNVPARQLIGHTALQLIVHLPLVLLILSDLARTLPHSPPHFP